MSASQLLWSWQAAATRPKMPLDRIEVEYEPLPAIADMPDGLAPEAELVHESTSSNLAGSGIQKVGDVERPFCKRT